MAIIALPKKRELSWSDCPGGGEGGGGAGGGGYAGIVRKPICRHFDRLN